MRQGWTRFGGGMGFAGRAPAREVRRALASRLTAEAPVRRPPASGALAIASARSETGCMVQNFDLGEFIREQRRTAQISVRQLAKLAGVSNPYLSQIERGLRRPSAEIMQQIAKGLRISAEALYVQAGILDERVVGGVVIDAIIADPTITERQKQVMVEVYDSFRKENLRRDADEAAASRAQASGGGTSVSGISELDGAVGDTSVPAESAPGHSASGHSASGHSGSAKTVTAPSARVTPLRTTMSRSTSPRRPR
jgi:transcriptional regulator with XRE-family HTH domain